LILPKITKVASKPQKFSEGVTLIELLLSMVIISFIMVAVTIVFTAALRDWKWMDPKLLIQGEAAIAMNKIERQLKRAGSIYYADDKSVVFTPLPLAAPEVDGYTVSLWRFDEGGGTTAGDETGTNDANLGPGVNQPTWVGSGSGESNDALRFDGADDYVEVSDSGSLDIADRLTVEVWVQPESGSADEAVVYKEGAYRLYINSSDRLTGSIYYSGAWHDVTSPTSIPRNTSSWTHLALTYDKDEGTGEELKLYVNGHNVAAANHTHSIAASSNNLYIGYDGTNNRYPFDGVIDEVRVSNNIRRTKIFRGAAEDKVSLVVNGVSHRLVGECDIDAFVMNYYDENYGELVPSSGTDTQAERNLIKMVKVLLCLEKDGRKFSLGNIITLRKEKTEAEDDAVAHWEMDEANWNGIPDEVVDSSGENHGTAYGANTVSPGKVGTHCGTFDGNDYIAIDNLYYSTAGQIPELTVCAWFNTSFSGGSYTSNWALVDFDRSENYNFYVRGDDGRLGFSTKASSGGIHDMIGSTVVNDGKWHFACAVYDGTDKIIYLDGKQDAISSNAHGGLSLGSGTTRYGFIGDGSEATTFNGSRNNFYYEGLIDDVWIYHRALSPGEIKARVGFIDSERSDFDSGTYNDTVWQSDHVELAHP
jgi:type II secretory pathway pseudopilin PulG